MVYVGKLLESGHISRSPLDEEKSKRLLDAYLESLDFSRMYFTQQEVDAFHEQFGSDLHNYILLGNPKPAFDIFGFYRERVKERAAFVENLLASDLDLTTDQTMHLNRSKMPWPADAAEADELWTRRIKGEYLQAKLNEFATRSPEETIFRRYSQITKNIESLDDRDIAFGLMSALSKVYDPHSEYLSPSDLETFEINMRLSLVGIGAVLQSEDGYARIKELVPGGPAELSGRIKVNDRISAVAQGEDEFVDVVDMKLDRVVNLIRGEKNTLVRLQVIPSNAVDPSKVSVVDIMRDEVKLKSAEAKADIIDHVLPDGRVERLGWITLPSFYADMQRGRNREAKSTTRDVALLLERLKKERISGLVVDLRRNGGGSLEEAVNLTGLFIGSGPVVQSKDTDGNIIVSRDRDPRIAYDGPMVVLTSKLSASASEIFAAALQDYNRAVVVGDSSTFGKGTVQSMLELGQFMPPLGGDRAKAGALKLTIQQFYRISGGSTQLRGVESDIVLPTLTDQPEIGEVALKGPLPYDEVTRLDYDLFSDQPLFIDDLRNRAEARVANSREFGYVTDDLVRLKNRIAENTLSLNLEKRETELEAEKARREARKQERETAKLETTESTVYTVTLDNVDQQELQLASVVEPTPTPVPSDDENPEEPEEEGYDAERQETLNILSDLVELNRARRTVSVTN